jgi:hypothetical protein
MTLAFRLRHELPDAIVQSAVNYWIRESTTIGGANALIFDGRPFSQNGRSIKIDLNVSLSHRDRHLVLAAALAISDRFFAVRLSARA